MTCRRHHFLVTVHSMPSAPGHEWLEFYNGDAVDGYKAVCRLPLDLCRRLRCHNNLVRVGRAYVRKAHQKHGLQFDHFPMMAITILYGEAHEEEKGLSFFFRDHVVFGSTFFVALKRAACGAEIWVRTFHRKSAAEQRRMTKKMVLLREQY